jgi:hypothetical protein
VSRGQDIRRHSAQPVQLEKLSVKEETILLKSSKINGGKYPPLKPGTQPVKTESSEPFT